MSKVALWVFCLGVFVGAGTSLNCYQCVSDKLDDCVDGAPGIKKGSCGYEHPQILQFCLYKTLYDKAQKKDIYISSCETIRKPIGRENNKDIPVPEAIIVLDRNVQQCQPNETHEVKQCDVCKTNLCNYFPNSAPASNMNIFHLLYLPALYFFTKFTLY